MISSHFPAGAGAPWPSSTYEVKLALISNVVLWYGQLSLTVKMHRGTSRHFRKVSAGMRDIFSPHTYCNSHWCVLVTFRRLITLLLNSNVHQTAALWCGWSRLMHLWGNLVSLIVGNTRYSRFSLIMCKLCGPHFVFNLSSTVHLNLSGLRDPHVSVMCFVWQASL